MSTTLVLGAAFDTHSAHPAPLTAADWVVLAVICSPIVALLAWGVVRARQARDAVRAASNRSGFEIVHLKQRFLRLGPFFPPRRSDLVYRITVRDPAGRERMGWARWRREWPFSKDTLDVRWDE
jgi:hypothetical protein